MRIYLLDQNIVNYSLTYKYFLLIIIEEQI